MSEHSRRSSGFRPVRTVDVDLSKEKMKFSSGHFTIFSDTEREHLHGHNFSVSAVFTTEISSNGMLCDYGRLKDLVQQQCDVLDELFLIPERSPCLHVSKVGGSIRVRFADDEFLLPQRDVLLLPLTNITVEELSVYIAESIYANIPDDIRPLIRTLSVRVSSGPGQGATTRIDGDSDER